MVDPDKPGTTGETLSVLTNALMGMDHKLLIILNKVDITTTVHDFARAYGSLCWNLSKVIPRKDLPRIYTMCTPLENQDNHQEIVELDNLWKSNRQELELTRNEVIQEIKRAPERRVDNMITHLYDSARLLSLHCKILESVRSKYQTEKMKIYVGTASLAIIGNGLSFTNLIARSIYCSVFFAIGGAEIFICL